MADDAPDYAGQIAALQLGLEVQWVMFGAVLVFLMQAGFTAGGGLRVEEEHSEHSDEKYR